MQLLNALWPIDVKPDGKEIETSEAGKTVTAIKMTSQEGEIVPFSANTVLDGTNKKFEKCELLSKSGEPLGQALIHSVKSDVAQTFRDQFRTKGPHNKQNKADLRAG